MSIDNLSQLLKTKHFDHESIEARIRDYWKANEIFAFNPELDNQDPIIIDSPPPYANGALHHGHGMSYTQLDIIARYYRMRRPTLLPLAFDDNGLPTERYTEKIHDIQPGEHPSNFFDLCKQAAMQGINTQLYQFDRLGFSYNHQISYRTIDDRAIRITQLDFLKLYENGHIIRQLEPQLYCTHCQTALAQADLETTQEDTEMHYIEFPVHNSSDTGIIIGTTRPELIPAAVALFYHPDDEIDYKSIEITNPITNTLLPILADEQIDRNQGTGIMMCATFGDQLDIELYRRHNLPNRTIIDHKGRITYPKFDGMTKLEARSKIITLLKQSGHYIRSEAINHQIPICERCSTSMEIIESKQWSLDILSIKEDLLSYIDQIQFHPSYMKKRLINWIKGLKWNWTISRQRYYGIPIPIFHCIKCKGITAAQPEDLPILPGNTITKPCSNCGNGTELDPDIFDTWMASSLSPRILTDKYFQAELSKPLTLRTQAHEIIRTWAFYTIVKQYLSGKNQTIPWNHLLILGWGLGFKHKGKRSIKASKSSGSGKNPISLIDEYGADAFRYWAANVKLGKDQHLLSATLNRGRKLTTKMYNAAKITFILLYQTDQSDQTDSSLITPMIDSITELISSYDKKMQQFQYSDALQDLETQFWNIYCSTHIEAFKSKAYEIGLTLKEREALAETWISYLRLFAPFMPFITEYLAYLTWQFNQQNITEIETSFNEKYISIHSRNQT